MTTPTPQEIEALLARGPRGDMPLGPWLVARYDTRIDIIGDGGMAGVVTLASVPIGVMTAIVASRVAAMMADAPDLALALRALAEERDRLAARSYELAVAIMGGEDAPGYADSVDTETLVEQLRGDRRRERVESERLASENARLRAECARQANVLEGGDWSDDLAEPPHATGDHDDR